MNLIVAIFLYLGLANSTEAVITEQDILTHQTEINQAKTDPGFYEFLEDYAASEGIGLMDVEAGQ